MTSAPTLQLINKTGSELLIAECSKINDDFAFSGINSGDRIGDKGSKTLTMNENSVPFLADGVGCNITFVDSDFNMGGVYLDNPVIGGHHLDDGNGTFCYELDTPARDNYILTVSLSRDIQK